MFPSRTEISFDLSLASRKGSYPSLFLHRRGFFRHIFFKFKLINVGGFSGMLFTSTYYPWNGS